ncbi:MAG: thiamine-phosphate kinase [Sedimentisphaerales bacterium]|nr:thiamine-phosphate kinase [Sedimentisphaerales bacterium]
MSQREFEFIDWLMQCFSSTGRDITRGIGDDMAVMMVNGEQVLITTDVLLEGVHFDLSRATPRQVGYKAMACSLSDCAAMAALPWCAVVGAAIPRSWNMDQARELTQGLQKAAKTYDCPLVGGDTTSWDNRLVVNVTMLARAQDVEPVLRSGAQVGDVIFVTGELGGSLAGRHLEFVPRVNEARRLAKWVHLHAMIDLSDGLAGDLGHICQGSRVGAIINKNAIPICVSALKSDNPLKAALADGEDFELLFTVSAKDAERLQHGRVEETFVKLTPIGEIVAGSGEILLRDETGKTQPLTYKGWEHHWGD